MTTYKPAKSNGIYMIIFSILLFNLIMYLLMQLMDFYIIRSLVKVFQVYLNVYIFYYIALFLSVRYSCDENNLYINSIIRFKNITIPIDSIQGYNKSKGNIQGTKLYGIGKRVFMFGKAVINNIGTTHMFVTNTENVIYILTDEMTYAISPKCYDEVENILKSNNIKIVDKKSYLNKNLRLHRDKKFIGSIIIVSIIILMITIIPFILYWTNKLPIKMPLYFNSYFIPVKYGTGKQFAIKQSLYGFLNMAIYVCIYYAAFFYAKYDKKSAYKLLTISIIIPLIFLIMQIRVLYTFC